MSIFNKKNECSCEAEVYIAKKTINKRPLLKWKRVYDTQDDISYIVEFDDVEYSSDIIFENENIAYWKPPFDLIENKVYLWRVKSFDGYEYSEYSKNQYVQHTINDSLDLMSFIDVKTNNRKNFEDTIQSKIDVHKTIFNSNLESEIYVDKVKKFQPSEIFISLSPQTFLSSELSVIKKNYDCLGSEIYIKTKRLLPPKAPLFVEMQSEFDFVTGNTKPIFSWWKSVDELFFNNISYEIQIDTNTFFFEPIFFSAKNIKNPISEQMVYPIPIELPEGKFYWRVRSTDGVNYSEWVYGTNFEIDSSTESLCAEINVVNQFNRNKIQSEIEVYPKKILESELTVFGLGNSFLPSITTVWDKKNELINSELYIYVGNTIEALMSELYVEYKFNDESSLRSRVYIYPICNLPCEIEIYMGQIICDLYVLKDGKHTDSSELNCFLEIKKESNIQDRINCELIVLKNNFINSELYIYNAKAQEEIKSEIFIYPVCFDSINSKVNVMKHAFESIISKIYVCDKNTIKQLPAKINVKKTVYFNESKDLLSEIKVIKKINKEELLKSYIYVNKKFVLTENKMSEIFVYNKEISRLEAALKVKSVKLDEIKVFSDKNQEEWFNDNDVKFWWEISEENEGVVSGYIMQFNQIPDYDPQLGKDYYQHSSGNKTFNAKVFDVSGEYYFHIQSFDKYYRTSPVAHYKVLYNNKPSIPENLKINGKILDAKNKLVSKNEKNLFSWDFSYDLDQNDWCNIKYELQICNKPLFEVPDFNSELIEDNFIELSFEGFLFSGTYYFRVRSFDGKEYSDWSKISSFIINTAPSIPTDISFSKKK